MPLQMKRQKGLLNHVLDIVRWGSRLNKAATRRRPEAMRQRFEQLAIGRLVTVDRRPHPGRPLLLASYLSHTLLIGVTPLVLGLLHSKKANSLTRIQPFLQPNLRRCFPKHKNVKMETAVL